MARRFGSSGLCFRPAGFHGRFPQSLPPALAILFSLTRDAGYYTDNATSRIPYIPYSVFQVAAEKRLKD
jgi:hypothetical protein